MQFLTKNNS